MFGVFGVCRRVNVFGTRLGFPTTTRIGNVTMVLCLLFLGVCFEVVSCWDSGCIAPYRPIHITQAPLCSPSPTASINRLLACAESTVKCQRGQELGFL